MNWEFWTHSKVRNLGPRYSIVVRSRAFEKWGRLWVQCCKITRSKKTACSLNQQYCNVSLSTNISHGSNVCCKLQVGLPSDILKREKGCLYIFASKVVQKWNNSPHVTLHFALRFVCLYKNSIFFEAKKNVFKKFKYSSLKFAKASKWVVTSDYWSILAFRGDFELGWKQWKISCCSFEVLKRKIILCPRYSSYLLRSAQVLTIRPKFEGRTRKIFWRGNLEQQDVKKIFRTQNLRTLWRTW